MCGPSSLPGPVAVARDPTKIVKLTAASEKINIFTPAGVQVRVHVCAGLYARTSGSTMLPYERVVSPQIGTVQPRREKIVDMGWTDSELLVVVYHSGAVDMCVDVGLLTVLDQLGHGVPTKLVHLIDWLLACLLAWLID